ncbi:MAG TPA: UDP-N-acetylmuramoyl-L-alanyl-D-glutamate--2,6-diaminopimelate ligase [Pirellulales bacterium]|jgi:UDP-N-acetylmuramoyl-L-alanyl-D-glutamate--2,6-diaminopimelate ligase|nr:UDP-N-acetylmuramoyl-L-alanyl-D-glutamate--2,6-diaminopimelate ligase [Pirellulales bacterium]
MPQWTPLTRSISLRQLFPKAKFFGADDIIVSSIAGDWQEVAEGDLFAALVGSRADGHHHVDDALRHGATAVLAERFVPTGGLPLCVVPDTRVAFARIAQALVDNPSRRLKVIGVTGTSGKTTTSWLIRGILEAAGHATGMLGTIELSDGQWSSPSPETTPSAAVLAQWLSRMESVGCSHAVMEISSEALSQGRIEGIELHAACITNVRRNHLDIHNTLANYRSAKAKIFSYLATDGFAVLNADDPVAASFASAVTAPLLTAGMRAMAEVTAEVVDRSMSEQTFLLTAGCDTVAVRTRMIGDHHVSNCLIAATTGLVWGFELSEIARGLERVEKVPGRMERIECGQSFGVFVDYARTSDALAAALDTLREVTPGRVICVFGAEGEQDRDQRPLLAAEVERQSDLAVLTQTNPRCEPPTRILRDVLRGFERPNIVEVIPDRTDAIGWALSQAEAGDCVLIAGRGHEEQQFVGNRRLAIDDRQSARQWLYSHGLSTEMLVPAWQRQRAA